MFIFLTPKIVNDPSIELERIRMMEMFRRPGDLPEFLCRLEEAEDWERAHTIHGSLMWLFGRPPERCFIPIGEYDGR